MILELSVAVIIGCLLGLAVYETALILCAWRRPDRRRLVPPRARESRDDRLYDLGAWLMSHIPGRWSTWLIRKLGDGLTAKLAAAGMGRVDATSFIGAGIVLAVAGFAAGWLAMGGGSIGLSIGVIAAYGVYRWPRFQIEARSGTRRLEFARLLPDFIDMLAIGVEAGLSLDRGVRLYCERFDNVLAKAFAGAMMEIELGKPRRLCFEELADKNQNDDLTWFIMSVAQAEKLGSPLARALKEQAKAGRERQSELVKELSAVAPIKMLFPIAGLILPALLIVIIGPAFLQFMR